MKTKTKLTIAVASVLSVAALAGTGYAGWVISKKVSKDTTGNVQVYDVVDHGVTRSDLKFEGDKNNIIWGKPADYATNDSDWLTPGSDVEDQYLNPIITFTVSNNDTTLTEIKYKPSVTATITIIDNSDQGYQTALTSEYIDGYAIDPKGVAIDATDIAVNQNNTNKYSYDCTLTLSAFKWGNHFGGNVNPYTYYNSKTLTDQTDIDAAYSDAKTALDAISKLKGVSFKVTITAGYNEANN